MNINSAYARWMQTKHLFKQQIRLFSAMNLLFDFFGTIPVELTRQKIGHESAVKNKTKKAEKGNFYDFRVASFIKSVNP